MTESSSSSEPVAVPVAAELEDTLNSHWKKNKSGFGYRMLQKMGWSEDKGLGKDGSGMTSHLKMKKRDVGLGLGMEGVVDDTVGSKAWSSTVTSFNSVLDILKNNYRKDVSDEESSKNKKKKNKKEKKEKKKRKRDEVEEDAEEVSEEKEEEVKKKKKRPLVSVHIKYKKFHEAKDLSSKSHHDKRAIFGHHVSRPAAESN
eukprot:gene10054-11125_t